MTEHSPKEEKRQSRVLEFGDIRASLGGGYIIVRDVPTNQAIGLSREEAMAVAKWVLENFE